MRMIDDPNRRIKSFKLRAIVSGVLGLLAAAALIIFVRLFSIAISALA